MSIFWKRKVITGREVTLRNCPRLQVQCHPFIVYLCVVIADCTNDSWAPTIIDRSMWLETNVVNQMELDLPVDIISPLIWLVKFRERIFWRVIRISCGRIRVRDPRNVDQDLFRRRVNVPCLTFVPPPPDCQRPPTHYLLLRWLRNFKNCRVLIEDP